jgi:hypothetical protein
MSDWEAERRARDERRRAEMLALPAVQLRRHAAVASPQAGDVLVTASIGPSHEAVALWATAQDSAALRSRTSQPGWATFADARTPHRVDGRVTVHRPDETVVTRIDDLRLAHPAVQPLPGGRILVVGARCRWRATGPDRNAVVYDSEGQVVTEQTLGDGIEHVLTTPIGRIWVGYFDEGVYGNYGWGDLSSPAPIGACGLVRFSTELQLEWEYPVDSRWGSISDCYALNVDGEDAWACYYTGFPVVRIDDGSVAGWRNPVARGARALLASDAHAAFVGGYGPDADSLVVCRRADDEVLKVGEYRLELPDDAPVPPSARVVGRGAELHVLTDDAWYRLDLTQLTDRGRAR